MAVAALLSPLALLLPPRGAHLPPTSPSVSPRSPPPLLRLLIELEHSDLLVPSAAGEMRLRVRCSDGRPLGDVCIHLELVGTASPIATTAVPSLTGCVCTVPLLLDGRAVEQVKRGEGELRVSAQASGSPGLAHARVVSRQRLTLLMRLQRKLLFSVCEEGGDGSSSLLEERRYLSEEEIGELDEERGGLSEEEGGVSEPRDPLARVLSLVEASLLHKLRSPPSPPSLSSPPSLGMDSASPSFALMLARMRLAAGFSSPPWHDPKQLAWEKPLREGARLIRDELSQMILERGGEEDPERGGEGGGAEVEGGEGGAGGAGGEWESADYESIAPAWRVHHLWKHGEWLPSATRSLPHTVALLRSLQAHGLRLNPMQNVACAIARQPPHSGIAPHCDGNLLGLTAHLGLVVPPGCHIEVGGERREWGEGEILLFDTTYTHSTANDSPDDRYVLLLNVLRPGVSDREVSHMREFLHAPSFHLHTLNPFYLSPPHEGGGGDATPTPRVGATFPAKALPDQGRVQISPTLTLPLRPSDGKPGLVLIAPLSGTSFTVLSPTPLPHHYLPSRCARGSAGFAEEGERLKPVLAAVDAEGGVEWVGLPHPGTCDRLWEEGWEEMDEFDVPLATLRQHLRALTAPSECFYWVPVFNEQGVLLLEEESAGREKKNEKLTSRALGRRQGGAGAGKMPKRGGFGLRKKKSKSKKRR
ncbi:MAG: hypothetical protein SGPRY_012862 [Prymnesium sp.]